MYISLVQIVNIRGENTLDNKTSIVIAVLLTAMVCIAGTYVLAGGNERNSQATLYVAGSTTVEPLMVSFQEEYEKYVNVTLNVTAQGSGTAAPALRNGTASIGMLSRDINSSESDLIPLVIARDGVVIVVDKRSGITDLTLEQLAKIYNKEYTNWNQVGGNNLTISPIVREAGSGTRDCIDTLMAASLGIRAADFVFTGFPEMHTGGSMLTQIYNTTGGIGYVNLGSLRDVDSSLTVVKIDGVMPGVEVVLDNTYELSRDLLLATIGQPTGHVEFFFHWIMSPDGQKIVEKEGFVPIGATSW